jgi:hypothetical protein
MKFPLEIYINISAKKSLVRTLEITADKLRRGLKRHKVADLSEKEHVFEFRGGMFRMTTNWNLFYPVSTAKISLVETNEDLKIGATLYYTGASLTHAFFLLGIIFINVILLKQHGLSQWPLNLFFTVIGILAPVANFSISKARIQGFLKEVLS